MTKTTITTANFMRDNQSRLVTVYKTKNGYEVECMMPNLTTVTKFKTEEDALNKLGAKSLAGWRNFFQMSKWTELSF